MTVKETRDIKRKLNVINYARKIGNVCKACRYYGISKSIYYVWIERYRQYGDAGLINKKPCPENLKLRTPKYIEEKVIYLRKKYHFGPERIYMYLKRFHGIQDLADIYLWQHIYAHGESGCCVLMVVRPAQGRKTA